MSLLSAAACSPVVPPGSDVSFVLLEAEAFDGYNPTMALLAFDLVLADADLDGDPDLLINWHHLGPLEVFFNERGVLRPADPGDRRESGLAANTAAPGLFRNRSEAEAAASAHGEPGLYLWHDADRTGAWQFLWTDPSNHFGGLSVNLETSLRFQDTSGLAPEEIVTIDERHGTVILPPGHKHRRFSVRTHPIGAQFVVTLGSSASGTPRLFAGVPPVEQPETVSLWKPDPHGMAWVDVEGTAHPELFVTRGGLAGELVPPIPPKADRYYTYNDGRYSLTLFPPGYGRGRVVEWVDIDNDGLLELSVANEATPNQLFALGEAGFADRAGALGLDLEGGGVQCWGDADDDGFQDLFYLDERNVRVLLNQGGTGFSPPSDGTFEIRLPDVATRTARDLFDRTALRLADFDADGDLDLWVLGRGERRQNTLFLREENGFVDASERTGIATIVGNNATVLADFDNDGYEDLFMTGAPSSLWINDRGRRFVAVELPFEVDSRILAAAAADIDGDGGVDIVLAGLSRFVLKNLTPGPRASFQVELRDPRGKPIGALVTVVYADGRRVVRRLGSERTTFSQTAEPLRFASGAGNVIDRIDVRWPGNRSAASFEWTPGDDWIVLERTDRPVR